MNEYFNGLEDFELTELQKKTLDSVSKNARTLVNASRRSGMTTVATIAAATRAKTTKSTILVAAPNFTCLELLFDGIKDILGKEIASLSKNKKLVLNNGSVISFNISNSEMLVGYDDTDLIIVDVAHYAKGLESIVKNNYAKKFLILGTIEEGREFAALCDDPVWPQIHGTYRDNPFVDEEHIALCRQNMSEADFASQFEARILPKVKKVSRVARWLKTLANVLR